MERWLKLALALAAIVFALSLVILFAIGFGLIDYNTAAQTQRAKEIVITGINLGVIWVGVLLFSCLGLFGRVRKVLLGKRSVPGAYISNSEPGQEET